MIAEKINSRFFSVYEYKIYENDRSIWNINNLYYKYITFLLKKHNIFENIKTVECDKALKSNLEKIYDTGHAEIDYKMEPKLSPDHSEKNIFNHKNINVYIQSCIVPKEPSDNKNITNQSSQSKNDKFYSITSSNHLNIKLFLEYLDEIRIEYHKETIQLDTYKYFTFGKKNEWIKHDINVNKTIENIFLGENKKSYIIDSINVFVNGKKLYDKYGLSRKISFLLYGLPGNGKSSLVYAIAKSYEKKIYKLNIATQKEDFMEQVNTISNNSIILIEDIDTIKISHDRKTTETTTDKKSESLNLSDILEVLDGYCYFNECMVFMTTNHIDKLDSALIRPGRMDHKIEFENANKEQIIQIIKYFYNKDISKKTLTHMTMSISVSELINTIIIPHLDDYRYVIDFLTK